MRARLGDLLSQDADPAQVRLGHTGGSTGRPLAFYYDQVKHERMRGGMYRGFMMSGWCPGQKILHLWGARRDLVLGGVMAAGLGEWLARERALGAQDLSEAQLRRWVRVIQRWRPVLLYGYASALAELARWVEAIRAPLPGGLIGCYSTAEVLDPAQRGLMERAFGCKVYNQYGCREVPNIAWECRHGGLHVCADLVYLESLPAEGAPRLVVTSLTNWLMPFIRYDLGDSGRLLPPGCPCRSPFPLLEMDLCRHNDLIRTRSGRCLHPSYLNALLYGQMRIRQYQWVQGDLDRITLNLVCPGGLDVATLETLAGRLHRELDGMRLEVRYLDEIPRSAAGKHRFVIGMGLAGP